jgi:hypothetical protein
VSVLELNRGIAKTDAQAAALERTNSGLRERVAKLDNGERIQQLAAARGFVMPQPGDVTYVRPRASDGELAAARITAPSSAAATQSGYTTGVQSGGAAASTSAGVSTGTGTGTGTASPSALSTTQTGYTTGANTTAGGATQGAPASPGTTQTAPTTTPVP